MSLTETLSALTAELRARRHQERFADARSRHTALAGFDDLASLVVSLTADGERSYATSEALTVAFIAEQQRGPSPLWTGLLLLVCAPMLGALRASVRGDTIEPDELDASIVGHFLEAAQAHTLEETKPGQTLAALRSLTRRAVFGQLAELQAERQQAPVCDPADLFGLLDSEERCADSVWSAPEQTRRRRRSPSQKELARQVAFLRERCDDLDDEQIELVMYTLVLGGSLVEFVDERFPHLSECERSQTYERYKRRHARIIHRLREELAPAYDLIREGASDGR